MMQNSWASKILKYIYLKKKPVSTKEISKDVGIPIVQINSKVRYLVSKVILKVEFKDGVPYYYIPEYSKAIAKYKLEKLEDEK